MTYSTLRMTIGGVVLGTALAVTGIAKAEHEETYTLGETIGPMSVNPNISLFNCSTLDKVIEALDTQPAPVDGCNRIRGAISLTFEPLAFHVVGDETFIIGKFNLVNVLGQTMETYGVWDSKEHPPVGMPI